LLESELFGHERGAFTGAITTSIGIFESANKGTLFLDEIGEMALTTQCKLLKVVEEGSLRRIGSTAEVPVDVRTISATNRDVDLMLEKGEFREDLFYRISILRVALPPLSERLEDIAPLSEAILRERFSEKTYSLADSAMDKLKSHTWPGNIRELRNVLCRAVVGCEYRDLIIPDDIEFDVGRRVTKSEQPHHLRTFKDKLISDALESTNGNVALTAKLLGVSKSGLHKRLRLNRGV
jgi:transcriptional regulator with PAS, ATPase and Fis domain